MIAGDTGDIAARIYSYMAGIVKEHGAVSLSINGMPDHVHLLIKSSKSVSDSDFMKALKGGSSRWINDIDLIPGHFKWQAGYGWFSVSPKDTGQVATSIENQAEHHKKATFQDEYRRFLKPTRSTTTKDTFGTERRFMRPFRTPYNFKSVTPD